MMAKSMASSGNFPILLPPVGGHLTALSGGKALWGDFMDSRPERRFMAPLKPMVKPGLSAPVALRIIGS